MQGLRCEPHGIYADCTVGGGGHAEAILAATGPDGRFIGIDRDPEAIRLAGSGLEGYGKRVRLFQGTFDQLEMFLRTLEIQGVDGILMDLGVSTMQLMDPARGFSFQQDGPLDMRMDPLFGETAADLVNSLPEQRLAGILFEYGEERWARRISRAILEERQKSPITRTVHLAQIIRRAIPRKAQSRRLHPATRTFQALRIAVNRELETLSEALQAATASLNPAGRLCVIAFHSLEDRIVKRTFRALSQASPDDIRIVTKKPLVPGREEIRVNPRSRSAKLRILERYTVNRPKEAP